MNSRIVSRVLYSGDTAFSSSAEPQSYSAPPLSSGNASVGAAMSDAASASSTNVTNSLGAAIAEGNGDPPVSSAASPAAGAADTAASMLSTAVTQPDVTLDESNTSAAQDATFTAWTPPLPETPAVRLGAPRRSAAFRHSISAMPHSKLRAGLKHHSIPALRPRYRKFAPLDEYMLSRKDRSPQEEADAVPNAENAELPDRFNRQGVLRRPATAGQARTQTALHHQELGAAALRPQTAAASAGRAWRSGR